MMNAHTAFKPALAAIICIFASNSYADTAFAPGDLSLRHDLQLLNDSGVISISLTTWPLPSRELAVAFDAVAETTSLSGSQLAALNRLRNRLSVESHDGMLRTSAAVELSGRRLAVRSFSDTPRDDATAMALLHWSNDRFEANVTASAVANSSDGNIIRPDGTFVAMQLGNWSVSAGWQQRWWGPGRDGSMILSSNARPLPAIALRRSVSFPFQSKWLKWLGQWGFVTFMGSLDDSRVVNNALLFGARATIRPTPNWEIGVSRTAQWCGQQRPCGVSTFVDLLLGRDNRGVNIDSANEPGNQLGGFDARWTLPNKIPIALYAQWIGEDTRRGGPEIGSWLRQAGIEHWGVVGRLSHRTHFELSETSCRDGGLGFSFIDPNCGYEHSIYQTGYRYKGSALGHGIDSDGLSYSIGSTLVQSDGRNWSVLARYSEINRVGEQTTRHSLSDVPVRIVDIQLTHARQTPIGRLNFGVAVAQTTTVQTGNRARDVTAFVQWRTIDQ